MRKIAFLFLVMFLSLNSSFAQKLTKEEKAEEKEWVKSEYAHRQRNGV